jgi:hypothetical protein
VITLAQHEQRLVPGFFFNWILGMTPRLDLLNQPGDLLLVFVLVAVSIELRADCPRSWQGPIRFKELKHLALYFRKWHALALRLGCNAGPPVRDRVLSDSPPRRSDRNGSRRLLLAAKLELPEGIPICGGREAIRCSLARSVQ